MKAGEGSDSESAAGALGFWFASSREEWGQAGVIVTAILEDGPAHRAGSVCVPC